MTGKKLPFVVLWIEDQFEEFEDGANLFELEIGDWLGREVTRKLAMSLQGAKETLTEMMETPPDLIILDIRLPRTEKAREMVPAPLDFNAGWVIWYKLRRGDLRPAFLNVPIVVVTTRHKPPFYEEMVRDRRLVWIEKPVAPSVIVERAVELLKSRDRNPEHEAVTDGQE